jgi:hypothetical protein
VEVKVQPHVAWQMVGGEAVVVDLSSGRTVGLNEAGSFIWLRLASGAGEDLREEFAARFRVSEEVARADVGRFVDYLLEQNLVAKVSEASGAPGAP